VCLLPCWRRRIAEFVDVCHEPIQDESIQKVWIHERWCAEGIFALCFNLFDLLLFDRRFLGQGYNGCSVLLFSFLTDCEEDKFCSMRYYLPTLFRWNSCWNYLWYSIEMNPHRNNDTVWSRLIKNMVLPHIWLAQENITYIQWGNIT
jgi:hypothetical protein